MEYVYGIPIPSSVWVFIGIIAIIVFIVLFITVIPIISFSIRVSRGQIRCSSLVMYNVVVDKDSVAGITVVKLSEHPELKPVVRTFGAGLPGYRLGWFTLANGGKAFLAVSMDRAVVIKLKDGSYVILSPSDIDSFLERLRELGWIK